MDSPYFFVAVVVVVLVAAVAAIVAALQHPNHHFVPMMVVVRGAAAVVHHGNCHSDLLAHSRIVVDYLVASHVVDNVIVVDNFDYPVIWNQ